MFSSLSIAYLFFGGAGAAALVISCAIDLFFAREPFGERRLESVEHGLQGLRGLTLAFCAGTAFLAFGTACLAVDLGRVDRILFLFFRPSLSYLTVGSYALALLCILSVVHCAVRVLGISWVHRGLVSVLEGFTIIVGAMVVAYTGLMLAAMDSVELWANGFVPALFALSSLSSGGMLNVGAMALVGILPASKRALERGLVAKGSPEAVCAKLVRIDGVIILLELAVAFALVSWSGVSPFGISADSSQAFVSVAWWAGFVLAGLVVPLAFERASVRIGDNVGYDGLARCRLVMGAVALVLLGSFCLRVAIVNGGSHEGLELEDPVLPSCVAQSEEDAVDIASPYGG